MKYILCVCVCENVYLLATRNESKKQNKTKQNEKKQNKTNTPYK